MLICEQTNKYTIVFTCEWKYIFRKKLLCKLKWEHMDSHSAFWQREEERFLGT